MSEPRLAQAIHHVLRTDVTPAGGQSAIRIHKACAGGYAASNSVPAALLGQWLRHAVTAVHPPLLPPPSAPTSTSLVVALALPSCSAEESACMLLVASQPCWVFVPLDTRLPVARQSELLVESKANRLITWAGSSIDMHTAGTDAMSVSTLPSLPSSSLSLCCYHLNEETPTWLRTVSAKLPLYVLFTSGSTGRAKGVIGTRKGTYERVRWMQSNHAADPSSDCVVRTTRLTFVDAVAEILTAILSGLPLVHIEFQSGVDVHSVVLHQPSVFADAVAQYGVTRFTIVPSLLRLLLTAMEKDPSFTKRMASVRILSVSGEALPLTAVERIFRLLPSVEVLNLYGSTEVSGDITSKLVRASMLSDHERLKRWKTHGVPISDRPTNAIGESTRLRLHGDPDDESQEICVTGGAVAAGYLVNGELKMLEDQRIRDGTGEQWFRMGDLCHDVHGELFLTGRRDRQVKIRGNRVQLEDFERALQQIGSVLTHPLTREAEVVATTVERGTGHEVVAIFIVDIDPSDYVRPCGDCDLLEMDPATKRELFERLEATVGTLYVPQSVVLISNKHVPRLGSEKINVRGLQGLCERHEDHRRPSHKRGPGDITEGETQTIQNLVEHVLDVSEDRITDEATWLELGGDSIKATLLSWELENKFQKRISAAEIPTMKIADLVKLCVSRKPKIALEKTSQVDVHSSTSVLLPADSPQEFKPSVHKLAHEAASTTIAAWYSRYNQGPEGLMVESRDETKSPRTANEMVQMTLVARVDLGKCIDASPLVVRTTRGSLLALIGSHSHKFVCLELDASKSESKLPRTLWTQTLDDRIEASATLSVAHDLILVGTYSGTLYATDLASGNVSWKFQARDMIKSSAVIIDSLCLAIVGAYDRNLYGLDLESGSLVWRVQLPGSVYSTPVYDVSSQQVIVATTTGVVVAWTLTSRTKLTERWRVSLPAPVFASLVITNCTDDGSRVDADGRAVLVGCADGCLYALDARSGTTRWEFATEKPIFSSPSVFSTTDGSKWVTFGSHDGKLRKLAVSTGEVQWQTAAFGSEPIFASPFVASLRGQRGVATVVCAATTNGRILFVNENSGELLPVEISTAEANEELRLGEIFSSPVIVDDFCFVGTRSNELLVFKLVCE